jgi:hypothetical protein
MFNQGGKTADPGLDRIGTERFGEASGRSNGPLEEDDQKSVSGGEDDFWGEGRR